ncbi:MULTISPECIES: NADH-quinone oxidoreductase subunit NuoE [unclassified Candidatus Frackibacter]|uniref:NADH-quinone oxidoreductase subunit NuoE n=1 Tax=unclassified Candidatus Frackibacter TaxID=2648818 RepID=UPI000799E94F|nr:MULTISPECIES: NADH-quinone oxidoreductase subunit NuoE [unclassified Candidatus Frackibacter]KXS44481.1 MAG: NADH-quinone oxidoreductase, E subunit [Candidatus Frackibacter sp. T328-2]SDC77684.1 NADP-reducing hydrogenase subunit HndA [Candidatus Frackibacter sp. WG11]SEM90650.1 NADP-reducing hydrogenase subunit HndA [Candidatus Frackibacter sp. WG12]SFM00026.1 NADP-reducing hydrogenase subunit HndA [Candidatus Frackibacter sp. WG13]
MEAVIKEIIVGYESEKTPLISILHRVQDKLGYLSEEVLKLVAKYLDLPLSKVYGVASFYTLLDTEEKGENIVRVCESAPCHVKGSMNVLTELKSELGIDIGETTKDNKFSLELTSCLGVCGVAPAIMVNDQVYGNLTAKKLEEILEKY